MTRLSPWFGTIERRLSQAEEGRRTWTNFGSFAATDAGGSVRVWPRRCLTPANKDGFLRGVRSSSAEWRPLSAPGFPASRGSGRAGEPAGVVPDGVEGSGWAPEMTESIAFVFAAGGSDKEGVFLRNLANLGEGEGV